MHMTIATRLILTALLASHPNPRYGRDLGNETDLPSGTITPILQRLKAAGWLTSQWENRDAHSVGRPPRHYYQLTEVGIEQARKVLAGRRTITENGAER